LVSKMGRKKEKKKVRKKVRKKKVREKTWIMPMEDLQLVLRKLSQTNKKITKEWNGGKIPMKNSSKYNVNKKLGTENSKWNKRLKMMSKKMMKQ
jgi:hypothetical protein